MEPTAQASYGPAMATPLSAIAPGTVRPGVVVELHPKGQAEPCCTLAPAGSRTAGTRANAHNPRIPSRPGMRAASPRLDPTTPQLEPTTIFTFVGERENSSTRAA